MSSHRKLINDFILQDALQSLGILFNYLFIFVAVFVLWGEIN